MKIPKTKAVLENLYPNVEIEYAPQNIYSPLGNLVTFHDPKILEDTIEMLQGKHQRKTKHFKGSYSLDSIPLRSPRDVVLHLPNKEIVSLFLGRVIVNTRPFSAKEVIESPNFIMTDNKYEANSLEDLLIMRSFFKYPPKFRAERN